MSSLWIINKAGGLIYQADYFVPAAAAAGAPPLSANEALILAGTLHGIHAITARINPTRARGEGLECLRGDGFELHVRSTLTGASQWEARGERASAAEQRRRESWRGEAVRAMAVQRDSAA